MAVGRGPARPELRGVGTRRALFGQTHHALTDTGWDPSAPDTCQRGPHELVPLQAVGASSLPNCWPGGFRRFMAMPVHCHRLLCFSSTGGLLGTRPTLQQESLVHVGPLMFFCFFVFGLFVEATPSIPFSVRGLVS